MASSTCFSSLADDILLEIFIYLPLISVYRFKLVSKVWLSLLSNPNFITRWFQINNKSLPWIQYNVHIAHYKVHHRLTFRKSYPDSHSQLISRNDYGFSFEFLANEILSEGDELYLLGSSNGLVLCFSWRINGRGSRYHVCNPLTQKWVTIPSPPRRHASKYEYSGIFCENPFSASCCYKVVCIPFPTSESSNKFYVDMFNSDLGEWRSFEVPCDQDVSGGFLSRSVITLNGVVFFLKMSDKMLVYNLNQNNGSNGHRCSLINLPGPTLTWDYLGDFDHIFTSRTFGESEGRIYYAIARATTRKITVSIWVLDEDNWQMLHEDTSAEICFHPCGVDCIRLLGLCPVDHNVILLGQDDSVWMLNIQTKSFEELGPSILLVHPNMAGPYHSFVLKTMPTILPPPSWIDEDSPLNLQDVFHIADLFSSEQDLWVLDDEGMTVAEHD